MRFRIQVLNNIAEAGLRELPADRYAVDPAETDPHAILVRSAPMHDLPLPDALQAVARAGAGTNNIPVARLSERGVPVFNAPGANANAVKELVLAGMLLAARKLPEALAYVGQLDRQADDLATRVEQGKKSFGGFELAGRTLGVIGLGKIGCLVTEAALALGMKVVGYDPNITVDAAWNLSSQVSKAGSIDALLRRCDFVTLHVPLLDATRGLIDQRALAQMKAGAVLLNFSRAEVVDEAAVLAALGGQPLARYVCDFPGAAILGHEGVIALPHLGASTGEAEENCARMVVAQLRAYLEHGDIRHAVNFPAVEMPRESDYRIAIANANVPNMVGQISTQMAAASLNIHNMINNSRDSVAYTLLDVDSPVRAEVIESLRQIKGVLNVRYLPQH